MRDNVHRGAALAQRDGQAADHGRRALRLVGLEPGSLREGTTTMKRWQGFAASLALFCAAVVVNGGFPAAHAKPEGEMRFAVYVTVAPGWLDPAEAGPGFGTPFWFMYGLHDALVKPMPGNRMAPSLAESWTESPDR